MHKLATFNAVPLLHLLLTVKKMEFPVFVKLATPIVYDLVHIRQHATIQNRQIQRKRKTRKARGKVFKI